MSELNQFHRNQIGDLKGQKVVNVLNNLNNLTTSPWARVPLGPTELWFPIVGFILRWHNIAEMFNLNKR